MVRALLLDFNGTLSDDERLLFEVYRELFGRHGVTLTAAAYRDRLAGRTDEEVFRLGLGDQVDTREPRRRRDRDRRSIRLNAGRA